MAEEPAEQSGSAPQEGPEVLEVEVERIEPEESEEAEAARPESSIGPVVAGIIIDVLDVATIGLTGVYIGFLLGAPAGWYLARRLGLDRRRALITAILCGIYCTIPFTSPIPVATLIGVWARARQVV